MGSFAYLILLLQSSIVNKNKDTKNNVDVIVPTYCLCFTYTCIVGYALALMHIRHACKLIKERLAKYKKVLQT